MNEVTRSRLIRTAALRRASLVFQSPYDEIHHDRKQKPEDHGPAAD